MIPVLLIGGYFHGQTWNVSDAEFVVGAFILAVPREPAPVQVTEPDRLPVRTGVDHLERYTVRHIGVVFRDRVRARGFVRDCWAYEDLDDTQAEARLRDHLLAEWARFGREVAPDGSRL